MTPEQINMMSYLLGTAGAGMSAPGSIGQTMGTAAAQWGQSANYMALLKSLLGGLPQGAKMTGDKDSLNLKIPTPSLGTMKTEEPSFGIGELNVSPEVSSMFPPKKSSNVGGITSPGQGLINPFVESSPEISGAVLAGLSPEDISKALSFKFMQTELGQQRVKDIADMMYKGGMLGVAEREADIKAGQAETSRLGKLTELAKLARRAPLEVPGLESLTLDEWNALDTKTKAYSYYAYDAQKRGEEVMAYNEWATQTDEPTAKELYDIAKGDPEFNEWLFKYKEASATKISLSEKLTELEAKGELKARMYFTDPEGMTADLDTLLKTKRSEIMTSANPSRKKAELAEDWIEGKIVNKGGTILDKRLEDSTFIWRVKWPDGKTNEVKYAAKSD